MSKRARRYLPSSLLFPPSDLRELFRRLAAGAIASSVGAAAACSSSHQDSQGAPRAGAGAIVGSPTGGGGVAGMSVPAPGTAGGDSSQQGWAPLPCDDGGVLRLPELTLASEPTVSVHLGLYEQGPSGFDGSPYAYQVAFHGSACADAGDLTLHCQGDLSMQTRPRFECDPQLPCDRFAITTLGGAVTRYHDPEQASVC